MEKFNLLPPSAFESTCTSSKVEEKWKDPTCAPQRKVQDLILERAISPAVFSSPAQAQDINIRGEHRHLVDYERKYIDELITKQTAEISELKTQIQVLKAHHKEELAQLERDSAIKERMHIQQIAEFKTKFQQQEENYDSQVCKLSVEHQREIDKLSEILENIRMELTSVKSESEKNISDLQLQLEETRNSLETSNRSNEENLRLKNETIEQQLKQINQLKNYIGEKESIKKPQEVWKKEIETLENKLKINEVERENLKSNVQLMDIRLKSLNEILALHEAELSSDKKPENSKKECLLTRWREKVYALLVQQKSAEIVRSKDDQNFMAQIASLKGEISSLSNQKGILNHSLSELRAQHEMQINDNKKLQIELTQAEEVAEALDNQLTEQEKNLATVKDHCFSVLQHFQKKSENLIHAMSKLNAFGQRISFASSRVEMLQGLFLRREAFLIRQKDEEIKRLKNQTDDDVDENSKEYVLSELEKVTKERDRLANQLRSDNETWNQRLQSEIAKYVEEASSLRKTVEELEMLSQEKSQRCITLSEELQSVQEELQEANATLSSLEGALASQQKATELALEDQQELHKAQAEEEKTELNKKLNDALREQTKAVVSLRQQERQFAREKERLVEQAATDESYYKKQINHLTQQLKELEKDRNIMMATLRQEGLIGKVQECRPDPIPLSPVESCKSSPRNLENDKSKEFPLNLPHAQPTNEPLSNVLDDLEELTAAVLNEDVSDSDSED